MICVMNQFLKVTFIDMPIANNILCAAVFAVGAARIAPVSFMPNLYDRHEWRTCMVLTPPKIGGVNSRFWFMFARFARSINQALIYDRRTRQY